MLPPQGEANPGPLPRIIAITSGKGGVGKSSLAVNLGITLARSGHRVCILDGDTGLANINILLGLRPARGLEHVLDGSCPIEEVLLEGPHGLKVIPGANGIPGCVDLDASRQRRLVHELARIERDFDYLLLDTAAGISETTLDFLSAAHRVLLVITPEPTSLTDAFSLLKLLLRRHPVHCAVVVNMVAGVNEARAIFQRFDGAVRKYLEVEVDFLGFLQRDESLRSAVILQHPVSLFAQNDPSSRPFQRLAQALEAMQDAQPARRSFSRFWFRRFLQPALPTGLGSGPESRPDPESDSGSDPGPDAEPVPAELQTETELPGPAGSAMTPAPAQFLDSATDRLEALRLEWPRILESIDDPRLAQACLEELQTVYWNRFGQPAFDLPAVVDRLAADPETFADLLMELRQRLLPVPDAPMVLDAVREEATDVPEHRFSLEVLRIPRLPEFSAVPTQVRAVPNAEAAPVSVTGGAFTRASAAGTPVAGDSAPGVQGPVRGPGPVERPRCIHAYDAERFGSQEELTDRLRRLNGGDASVREWIRRL